MSSCARTPFAPLAQPAEILVFPAERVVRHRPAPAAVIRPPLGLVRKADQARTARLQRRRDHRNWRIRRALTAVALVAIAAGVVAFAVWG